MNTTRKPPTDDLQEGEVLGPQANKLELLNKSEIDQQIATAKSFPRSIAQFKQNLLDLVGMDEEVADECIYALPRKDEDGNTKAVEGPSARFAEIVLNCWKNCRAGARVVDEGSEFVTSQGAFYDLENNVSVNMEIQRRITNRSGRRYSADMIGVTSNAANSIAFRNAVLKGVPKAFWIAGYKKAQAVCAGDSITMVKKREEALLALEKRNVPRENVYRALGVAGLEDITTEKLVLLKGLLSAIRNSETTVEQVFFPEPGQGPDSNLAGKSMGKLDEIRQRQAASGAPPPNGGSSPKTEPSQPSSQPAATTEPSSAPVAATEEPFDGEKAAATIVANAGQHMEKGPRRKKDEAPGQPLDFDKKKW